MQVNDYDNIDNYTEYAGYMMNHSDFCVVCCMVSLSTGEFCDSRSDLIHQSEKPPTVSVDVQDTGGQKSWPYTSKYLLRRYDWTLQTHPKQLLRRYLEDALVSAPG